MSVYSQVSVLKKIYTGTFNASNASSGTIQLNSQTLGSNIQNTGTTVNYIMSTYSFNLQILSATVSPYSGGASWYADYYDHYGYGNSFIGQRNLFKNGVIFNVLSDMFVANNQPYVSIYTTSTTIENYNYVLYSELFLTQIT
jgi:hypothetical protein